VALHKALALMLLENVILTQALVTLNWQTDDSIAKVYYVQNKTHVYRMWA